MINAANSAERYQWDKPGERGDVRMISLSEIDVDAEYQRDEVSERNTMAIASAFSWSKFGTVSLAKRENGRYVALDGKQRILAARKRGDIERVPALVFISGGIEYEAQAFIGINCRRRPVDALVKFRAAVMAKIEPELSISTWLDSVGLKIRSDGRSNNVIDFPATFVETWKMDTESCKSAVVIQKKIAANDPFSSYIHKGLWWLEHKGLHVDPYVSKIIRLGGANVILKEINSVGIRTGKAAKSFATCGLGILSLINFRKKSKITISEDE